MFKTAEIEIKDANDRTDKMTQSKQDSPPEIPESDEGFTSELDEPRWSVVSYESVAVTSLTYVEAAKWMEKLKAQKISGLCIITDEAAERILN